MAAACPLKVEAGALLREGPGESELGPTIVSGSNPLKSFIPSITERCASKLEVVCRMKPKEKHEAKGASRHRQKKPPVQRGTKSACSPGGV